MPPFKREHSIEVVQIAKYSIYFIEVLKLVLNSISDWNVGFEAQAVCHIAAYATLPLKSRIKGLSRS